VYCLVYGGTELLRLCSVVCRSVPADLFGLQTLVLLPVATRAGGCVRRAEGVVAADVSLLDETPAQRVPKLYVVVGDEEGRLLTINK
jgi:hypothetical protein